MNAHVATGLLAILPALVCGLLSYIGLWFLVPALERRAILDHPGARSNHTAPTPRGGGLAVIVAILVTWPVFATGIDALTFIVIFLATFMLTAVSFLDDIKRLGPGIRFFAQVMAVLIATPLAVSGDGLIPGIPVFVEMIALGVLWLWFINLFNFMDGIDGLSGVEAIAIALGAALCLGLAASHGAERQLAMAIAGGAAAFLILNWHPAQVFMGDAGSIPLGFLIGGLLLALVQTPYWAAAIILPAYYWVDSGITILARLVRGERIWTAHSTHAYQKAVRGGARHDRVVLTIAAFNGVMIALAFLSPHAPIPLAGLSLAGALGLFILFSRSGTVAS